MAKNKKEEETDTNDVNKALELALAALDREFGKNTVIQFDSDPPPWPSVSTGAITLDSALGIGGLPKGRIVEIYGAESSSKTTLCLSVVANAQKMGLKCLFVDVEHAFDPTYAKNVGVDIKGLLFAQPSSGEEALDIVEKIVKTGAVSVVIVDSVPALITKAELDGTMSDAQVGGIPRLMSKAMRKLPSFAADTETLVVFTNQLRERVGVFYGNPVIQPGGRALKFQSSVRIELKRIDDIKSPNDGYRIGIKVKAKVVKNKMAPPFKEALFNVLYGKGVDEFGCIADMALERGVVTQKGAWISYNGQTIAQGRDKLVELLHEKPELAEELKQYV